MSQYDLFDSNPDSDSAGPHRLDQQAGNAPKALKEGDISETERETRPAPTPQERQEALKRLEQRVAACHACRLAQTRSLAVPGEGNPAARVLFIGEGPGRQEDLTGRPFVGPAGALLTRIIERGMGVARSEVYITNLVKCRPTVDLAFVKDRPPESDEINACSPFLLEQVELLRPQVIVAVGGPAAKSLLGTKEGITRLRGRWSQFRGIPVMPIYHPSYILRNGGEKSPLKKDMWEDIKLVMEKLGWRRPDARSQADTPSAANVAEPPISTAAPQSASSQSAAPQPPTSGI